jgi:hypothetical protein
MKSLLVLALIIIVPSLSMAARCEVFTQIGEHSYFSKTVSLPIENAKGRDFPITSLEVLVIPSLKDTTVLFAEEGSGYGLTGRITVLSEGKVVGEKQDLGDIDALPHPYLKLQIQGADLTCSN